jgi:hypothetical protein
MRSNDLMRDIAIAREPFQKPADLFAKFLHRAQKRDQVFPAQHADDTTVGLQRRTGIL